MRLAGGGSWYEVDAILLRTDHLIGLACEMPSRLQLKGFDVPYTSKRKASIHAPVRILPSSAR